MATSTTTFPNLLSPPQPTPEPKCPTLNTLFSTLFVIAFFTLLAVLIYKLISGTNQCDTTNEDSGCIIIRVDGCSDGHGGHGCGCPGGPDEPSGPDGPQEPHRPHRPPRPTRPNDGFPFKKICPGEGTECDNTYVIE